MFFLWGAVSINTEAENKSLRFCISAFSNAMTGVGNLIAKALECTGVLHCLLLPL